MKREIDSNQTGMIPLFVMIPPSVRSLCSLNSRLAKVKIFVPRSEFFLPSATDATANVNHVNYQLVRQKLVKFFPELEERQLLREQDQVTLRVNGVQLDAYGSSDKKIENLKQSILNCSEDNGEQSGTTNDVPIYIEIIPSNLPEKLQPYSNKVTDVKAKLEANLKHNPNLYMISFYKFVHIENPELYCSILSKTFSWMGINGRIYIATEGINAQVSVPQLAFDEFKHAMSGEWVERELPVIPHEFHGVYLNVDRALEFSSVKDMHENKPFEKLAIKPRPQILSDGFSSALDWNTSGKEMPPTDFHNFLSSNKSDDYVLLDCRNDYESQVGTFQNAVPLNTHTFRDSWEKLDDMLSDLPKDKPILTFCTGGIRCVKINSYLEQKLGFTNTNRLAGGIVSYINDLRDTVGDEKVKDLSLFKGVNHVFDGRMGEVVTDDLLDHCINCGAPCNIQTDCANVKCPRTFDKRIFVQCAECTLRMAGTCSAECCATVLSPSPSHAPSSPVSVTATTNSTTNATATASKSTIQNQWKASVTSTAMPLTTTTTTTTTTTATSPIMTARDDESEAYADLFSSSGDARHESALAAVAERTDRAFPNRAHIRSSRAQAQLLQLLVSAVGARRVLEVGTFTGYATLALAAGLCAGGHVVTLEKDAEAADIAQLAFGDDSRIDLIRGDAAHFMQTEQQPFDLAFVDADKGGYVGYVQALLDRDLLRVGGLLVVDNVLFRGEVARVWRSETYPEASDDGELASKRLKNVQNVKKTAKKLHRFNQYLKDEARVEQVILPFRDGLTIARRVS